MSPKETTKKWRIEHKEQWNEYMREYQKKYYCRNHEYYERQKKQKKEMYQFKKESLRLMLIGLNG